MSKISIDEEVLQQLLKQVITPENKKRKEGSYELYGNGRARLYYMLDNVSHRTTVDAKNDEEAQKELDSFIEKVKKGEFIDTNYTFAEFAQIWLDKKIKPNAGDRCVDKYIGALNTRILPYIGNIKLKKLTKQKLENYFNMIKNTKTQYANRKENSTVKPDTVKKWKSIIHACLEYAVDCELLSKNPCDKITIVFTNTTDEKTIKQLVKRKREKIKYYNYNEYKFVCNLAEEEFQYFYYNNKISNIKKLREVGRRFLVLLDLKTGMRRSELFGLTREDLLIKDLTFDVNKSRHYLKGKGKYTKYPKNDSSIRIKSFPKSLLKYLKLYYELLDNLNYTEEYIFEYLSIDGSGSWFDEWQDRNNIKNIKFHDLRHTHATILLYLGVDIKTISERLGHADIQTTLNIYADVLKELDIKSVEKIDTL